MPLGLTPDNALAFGSAQPSCDIVLLMFSFGYGTDQYVPSRETVLAAPGWARVGITALAPHVRTDAAQELARVIVAAIVAGGGRAIRAEEIEEPFVAVQNRSASPAFIKRARFLKGNFIRREASRYAFS